MADLKSLVSYNGTTSQIHDADQLKVGAGIISASTALNITTTGAGTITLAQNTTVASGMNLTSQGGVAAFDWGNSTGAFTTSSGTGTFKGTSTFTAAGTALTVNNGSMLVSGGNIRNTGVGNAILADGSKGVDVTSGTLLLGTVNASAVNIGKAGSQTVIEGDLVVQGAQTIVGGTVFDDAVVIGDNAGPGGVGNADVDSLSFLLGSGGQDPGTVVGGFAAPWGGRLGSAVNPDVYIIAGGTHNIAVDNSAATAVGGTLNIVGGKGGKVSGSTAAGAGGASSLQGGLGGQAVTGGTGAAGVGGQALVQAGQGGAAADVTNAANGGKATVKGGKGGDGASGLVAGAGGDTEIFGGNGGTVGGGTGNVAGKVKIDGGVATTTAVDNGAVEIGLTNASAVKLGHNGITTTITGAVTLDGTANPTASAFLADFSAASHLVTSGAALTLTAGAASTWSTSTGALTVDAATALNLGTTAATSVSISRDTKLTTVNGGLSVLPTSTTNGAVTLTAKADSSFTTDSGHSLTFTAGAASTWSTTAGALTVDAAAALNLGDTNATSIAMGHSGIVTTVTGGLSQLTGAVHLNANAASDFTTSAGSLTFDAATAVSIGATNATSIAMGHSGIITTVTGGLNQLTGAVNLTANAASQFTTSSGGLTLTAAAASTWSTTAGALSIAGATDLNLASSSSDKVNIKNGATNALIVDGTAATLTVQNGYELNTTGTGMINLPQNFKINSVATAYATPGTGQVTAANLNTLTAGPSSNADSLHTHSGVNAAQIIIPGTTTGLTTGDFVYVSGTNTFSKTDASVTTAPYASARCVGAYEGTSGKITIAGVIQNAKFVNGLTLTEGDPVFLSTTAGKLTNDVSVITSGVWAEVGIVTDASAYVTVTNPLADVMLQVKSITALQ
jgi:hypothetical protein